MGADEIGPGAAGFHLKCICQRFTLRVRPPTSTSAWVMSGLMTPALRSAETLTKGRSERRGLAKQQVVAGGDAIAEHLVEDAQVLRAEEVLWRDLRLLRHLGVL